MERSTIFKNCKPSMGHLYHGYVSHNQSETIFYGFSFMASHDCMAHLWIPPQDTAAMAEKPAAPLVLLLAPGDRAAAVRETLMSLKSLRCQGGWVAGLCEGNQLCKPTGAT